MSFYDIIRKLLRTRGAPEDREGDAARKAARAAWVGRTSEALRQAQREMDERCMEAVDKLDEQAFDRLVEAGEAKVNAFLAPLRAAADQDKWPWEMHWKCI